MNWFDSHIDGVYLFAAFLAAYIGAVHNNQMLSGKIKRAVKWKRPFRKKVILYALMPTKFWWGFILCSVLAMWATARKEDIEDNKRKMMESDQQKREELLRSEAKNDLKEITGNMSMMYGEGQKKNDQNAEAIKKQIRDSLNNLPPDLTILYSNHEEYIKIKESKKWDIVLGVINNGMGRAYNVVFKYREINKPKNGYLYYLLNEASLFHDKKEEVPPKPASLTNTVFGLKEHEEKISDTSYFILDLSYTSYSDKKYNSQQLFIYIYSTGLFNEYLLGADSNPYLKEVLIKNGYTHF